MTLKGHFKCYAITSKGCTLVLKDHTFLLRDRTLAVLARAVVLKALNPKALHLALLRGCSTDESCSTRSSSSSSVSLAEPFSRTSLHQRSFIPCLTELEYIFVTDEYEINQVLPTDEVASSRLASSKTFSFVFYCLMIIPIMNKP